jgi:hypothetical protein
MAENIVPYGQYVLVDGVTVEEESFSKCRQISSYKLQV